MAISYSHLLMEFGYTVHGMLKHKNQKVLYEIWNFTSIRQHRENISG